jgi:hypothetical protein
MAFFESKSGFWLMFAIFCVIVALAVFLRIENVMNYWHHIVA